jgi:hypothetical protein
MYVHFIYIVLRSFFIQVTLSVLHVVERCRQTILSDLVSLQRAFSGTKLCAPEIDAELTSVARLTNIFGTHWHTIVVKRGQTIVCRSQVKVVVFPFFVMPSPLHFLDCHRWLS